MKIYGYIRDSIDPDYSVDVQRIGIESWCRRNYEQQPYEHYTDETPWGGVNIFDRPAGSELFEMLQAGDMIVGYTLARCFTSIQQAARTIDELRERSIIFNVVELGYDLNTDYGELMHDSVKTWITFDSTIKTERIKERISDPDKPRNRHSPIGYKQVKSEGKSYFVPDEKERQIVRQLIEWKDIDGITWSEALRRMIDKPRASGTKWNQQNIRVAYKAGLDGFPGWKGQVDPAEIIQEKKRESARKRKIASEKEKKRD